ncbi:MAG TPA: GNAT family protein [Mycobacteriales bacterium]|nr:GNAT family protein [Mycobacteriales bacterium]
MPARAPGWPATLTEDRVMLRPLRLRDGPAWVEVRKANIDWLRPWEATPPGGPVVVSTSYAVFWAMVRGQRRQARRGGGLPFAVLYDGRLVGQLNIGGIVRGSLHSCHIGYWIDSRVAGRGIMTTAVAMATDHAFWAVGLHRVEINIRPENAASRRVVEKLGFREESLRRRFLHIDGEWRDHLSYALVREEVSGGLLARWRRNRGSA